MKLTSYYFLILMLLTTMFGCTPKEVAPKWKLGVQTYTFHRFTLKEALDKTQQLGLHYAEPYFSQELGQGFPNSTWLNYDLPEDTKKQLMETFASHNIVCYARGVASYDNEADWRRFLDLLQKWA